MNIRHRFLLIFILASSGTSFAQSSPQSQIDPEKRQLINRLFVVMGIKDNAEAMKGKIFALMSSSKSQEQKEVIDRVSKKFDSQKIVDAYIPIYDRHYSKDDLKGLISYYESPLGRKVVKESPAIAQEGLMAGAEMGREVGKEVEAELAAEKSAQDAAGKPN
ncbi:DUF2059 domain-containing protein [Solilutibacter silvestris]|uniref:DUF2059 domain-containing protein n=1 Tax=Solilutibacter silvestris TaxID=1645665 RepID=UPI003D352F85